jgi:hypothetical protein
MSDDLPVKPPSQPAAVVKNERTVKLEKLAAMEEGVFERSLETVEGVLAWSDYSPEDFTPDALSEVDEEERKKRRLAQAGWMPAGEAPIGIKLASQIVVGMAKARATSAAAQSGGQRPVVQINLPPPTSTKSGDYGDYEVIDVD